MEKCFYSGRRNAVIMKQDMGGKEYEKEKSHSGIDTDSHAFHRTSPNCICGNCRSDACNF